MFFEVLLFDSHQHFTLYYCFPLLLSLPPSVLPCRVMPQESGGRSFRNQTYIMISVAGDAVLVDYEKDSDGDQAALTIGQEQDDDPA